MMNNAILQFTDRAFLAHESMESLEAVLPAGMLAYILLGFFQSVVGYSGTFVAQYLGTGDRAMCRRSYHAGMWIALASGVLMLAALPFGAWVFETFANGPEVIARQKVYYNICTAGGVFLFGQMAAQSYFTGLGRTRIVLWVNIIGNALNVALDPILIFGWLGCPRFGIAGAAYATVFSTFVQWAILAVAIGREPSPYGGSVFRFGRSERDLVLRILRFGIPAGAYTVLNILSFTVFVFFTGKVGHVEMAVSNACFTVNYLLFAPMEGFALGAATLVGQAQGRGDAATAMKAGTRSMVLGVAVAAVLSGLAVAFHGPILSLFSARVGPTEVAQFQSLGLTLFVLMAAWQVFDAADVVILGALKGAGDTRFVMWWMMFVSFGIWLPLVWAVAVWHNTMVALWGTVVLDVVILCVGTMIRWFGGFWKGIKVV